MKSIREATVADAEAISELLEQLQHPSSIAHLRQKITRIQNSDSESVWVAVDSTVGVVGVLALQISSQFHQEPPVARIVDLCVRDTHRSLQFGQQLLQVAERYAQESGCCRIEVTANNIRKGAHRFYAQNGLAQTHHYFCKSI